MLTTELDIIIEDAVRIGANDVTRIGGIMIPRVVRTCLSELYRESLLYRADEWRRAHQAATDDPQYARETMPGLLRRLLPGQVTLILNEAVQIHSRGPLLYKRLTLIDVIQSIHENWCKIFPICRG